MKMNEDNSQNQNPASDDWKSSLPGFTDSQKVDQTKAANDTGETKIPEPPKPKNISTESKKEFGLPTPPKPRTEKADKYRETIAKIPKAPEPKPQNKEIDLGKERMASVANNLRKVRTLGDDILISEGKEPTQHDIDYNKVSSDENVNRFVKRHSMADEVAQKRSEIVSEMPEIPSAPKPKPIEPSTNYNIPSPRGVAPSSSSANSSLQNSRLGNTPIRRTLIPNAPQAPFRQPIETQTLSEARKMNSVNTPEKTPMSDDHLITPLRTLRGDVNQVVQNQNISLANIAIKEDQKRREEARLVIKKPKINAGVLLSVILILILGGGFAIWFSFFRSTEVPVVVPDKTNDIEQIIFADVETIIDISGSDSIQLRVKIGDELKKEQRLGHLKNILLVNSITNQSGEVVLRELITTQTMFEALNLGAPEKFLRLISDKFMLGIYAFSTKEPFMILEAKDYSTIFAQMLVWEESGLERDLYAALRNERLPEDLTGEWRDEIIENLDVRAFRSDSGNPYVFWSFIDANKTLVITTNKNTLLEVRNRFNTRGITR